MGSVDVVNGKKSSYKGYSKDIGEHVGRLIGVYKNEEGSEVH